jgi:hypothetical protein
VISGKADARRWATLVWLFLHEPKSLHKSAMVCIAMMGGEAVLNEPLFFFPVQTHRFQVGIPLTAVSGQPTAVGDQWTPVDMCLRRSGDFLFCCVFPLFIFMH